MRIIMIIMALISGILGLRLLIQGVKHGRLFFQIGDAPTSKYVRETLIRDIALGILLIILSIAILT